MHVCLLLFHPQGLQMYPHVVEPFINIWLQIPAIQNSIHAGTMASLSQVLNDINTYCDNLIYRCIKNATLLRQHIELVDIVVTLNLYCEVPGLNLGQFNMLSRLTFAVVPLTGEYHS